MYTSIAFKKAYVVIDNVYCIQYNEIPEFDIDLRDAVTKSDALFNEIGAT